MGPWRSKQVRSPTHFRTSQFLLAGKRQTSSTKSLAGTITRIVPGHLGYVDVQDVGVFPFRPNQLRIKKKNGALDFYKGEPFDEIGLHEGKTVIVTGVKRAESDTNRIVVIID